jgi:hypothetical protein
MVFSLDSVPAQIESILGWRIRLLQLVSCNVDI